MTIKRSPAIDEVPPNEIDPLQGDTFEKAIEELSPRLFAIILRLVKSPSIAEDILQDAWYKALKNINRLDSSREFAPWITRIAINCCNDYFRRDKLRTLFLIKQQSAPHSAGQRSLQNAEHREDIEKALQSLSPRCRKVIILKYYGQFSTKEISKILKIPEGTVKSRVYSAIQKMKRYFQRYDNLEL